MTATEQSLLLFGGVLAVFVVASIVGFALARRHASSAPNPTIDNLNSRIKAWWLMVIVIGLAFAFGKAGVIILFALASLAALREFITLTPTRRGDHAALAVGFFVVLPLQYYLIWIEWYGLYSIFIPVYAFLLLPIIVAVRGDTRDFMGRVAERGRDPMGPDDLRVLPLACAGTDHIADSGLCGSRPVVDRLLGSGGSIG
jgi:phosphatidate cytidylyltransferase